MKFKKYNDAVQLSLRNVLHGTYVNKNCETKTIEDDDASELFELFRQFVANTARGKRKQRILNCPSYAVDYCGILSRLYYDFEREEVSYICRQEWNSEMAVIRDCFD